MNQVYHSSSQKSKFPEVTPITKLRRKVQTQISEHLAGVQRVRQEIDAHMDAIERGDAAYDPRAMQAWHHAIDHRLAAITELRCAL